MASTRLAGVDSSQSSRTRTTHFWSLVMSLKGEREEVSDSERGNERETHLHSFWPKVKTGKSSMVCGVSAGMYPLKVELTQSRTSACLSLKHSGPFSEMNTKEYKRTLAKGSKMNFELLTGNLVPIFVTDEVHQSRKDVNHDLLIVSFLWFQTRINRFREVRDTIDSRLTFPAIFVKNSIQVTSCCKKSTFISKIPSFNSKSTHEWPFRSLLGVV